MLGLLTTDVSEPGQNVVLLSVYTPHGIERATLNGEEVGITIYSELGYRRYLAAVVLDPNTSQTIEFELVGSVDISNGYELVIANQPLVNDDHLVIEYRDEAGRRLSGADFVLTEDVVFPISADG